MKLPLWLGRIACALTKHKRGQRVPETTITFSDPDIVQFACPRCGKQWTRKVAQRKPVAP